MTSIGLHYIQESFYEPPQYKLAENDSYDGRCGEIFITLNRLLVFHCSICDKKYGELTDYIEHLSAQHYSLDQDNVAETEEDILTADTELHAEEEHNSSTSLDEESLNTEQKFDDDDNYELFDTASSDVEVDIKPDVDHVEEEYLLEVADNEDSLKLVNAANAGSVVPDAVRKKQDIKAHSIIFGKSKDSVSPLIDWTKHKKPDDSTSTALPTTYACKQCNKLFSAISKLRAHVITHSVERKFICTICGFAFKRECALNAHMRRHKGNRRFGCEMCTKRFFTRTEATAHQRTHTGERPYICSHCGIAFVTSGGLNQHMKRHNNDRPHKCQYCEKRFYDTGQLKNHMPVHTSERPFVCTICSTGFGRRYSLVVHMKLHANAKEYACNMCEKSFNQKPALLSHIKINHKVVESSENGRTQGKFYNRSD